MEPEVDLGSPILVEVPKERKLWHPLVVSGKLADVLSNWAPRFKPIYEDYFRFYKCSMLQVRSALLYLDTGVGIRARQLGEQRLMSMLIEPIQRLPRYTMILGNMIEHLPRTQPSIAKLHQVMDTLDVVCEEGPSYPSTSSPAQLLRNRIADLPHVSLPSGRFIDATVLAEILPPQVAAMEVPSRSLIGILFSDALLLLDGTTCEHVALQNVVEDVQKLLTHGESVFSQGLSTYKETSFLHCIELRKVRLTTFEENFSFPIELSRDSLRHDAGNGVSELGSRDDCRRFELSTASTEQTLLWAKTIIRARAEGRLDAYQRNKDDWRLYETKLAPDFEIVTAILEGSRLPYLEDAAGCRIIVDQCSTSEPRSSDETSLSPIIVSISTLANKLYRLETLFLDECRYRDVSSHAELLPLLNRRCKF